MGFLNKPGSHLNTHVHVINKLRYNPLYPGYETKNNLNQTVCRIKIKIHLTLTKSLTLIALCPAPRVMLDCCQINRIPGNGCKIITRHFDTGGNSILNLTLPCFIRYDCRVIPYVVAFL